MADAQSRFRTLYERHYAAVLAYALRRTEASTAEDIAAETFLIAWRRFLEVPEDALPWLLAVARNVLANHWRSGTRRHQTVSRLQAEPAAATSDVADQVAARSDILGAFQRLSERDQEALALVAWEGLNGERAARVLGCSAGAFWVRLHRARRRLARELALLGQTTHHDEFPLQDRMEVEPG